MVKSLEDMIGLFNRLDRALPERPKILMSLKGSIRFEVCVALNYYKVPHIRFWWTDTELAYIWVELTPYSKGNIWKIRCLHDGSFRVYYGTVKVAYCSALIDAINFIPKP